MIKLGASSIKGFIDVQRCSQRNCKLDKGVENEKSTNEKPDEDYMKENPTSHTPNHFRAIS